METWLGSRDLLSNFGSPSISEEQLKIQTLNLVCGLMTKKPIQKFAKLGQLGTGHGSHDLLLNFGRDLIYILSMEWLCSSSILVRV